MLLKQHVYFLFSFVLLSVGDSVPKSFYPFGNDTLDDKVDIGDDNCAGPVYLPSSFFGSRLVYVCTNGLLSFERPIVSKFCSIPAETRYTAYVAPFCVDLNTNYGNDEEEQRVYYRLVENNVTLFTTAREDIQNAFIDEHFCSFEAEWLFIATWYRVPHGDLASKVSTFQVVLMSNGNDDFVVFNYAQLKYSDSPVAGYDLSDEMTYYALPGYKSYDIVNLASSSNIGITGHWIFFVQKSTVRLADSGLLREGRLEIYHDNEWGTVCKDGFDEKDVAVVCQSLGFRRLGTVEEGKYGPGKEQVWLTNVQCYGNETRLEDCIHDGWGINSCNHDDDVSISCQRPLDPPINDILRLAGSQLHNEGRLEVFYNGSWGTVCDDQFTKAAARVACNTMGFGFEGRVIPNTYQPGEGLIWLDDVVCTGLEEHFSQCSHKHWGDTGDCSHDEDVAIACTEETTSVRLIGGSWEGEGRLEVYHDFNWGTVCLTGFADVEAKVVCNSLDYGFFGETEYNKYGPGSGNIVLDEVHCTGCEMDINNCRHLDWGVVSCLQGQEVAIECYRDPNYDVNGVSVGVVVGISLAVGIPCVVTLIFAGILGTNKER